MRNTFRNRLLESGSLMIEAMAMLALISLTTPIVYKQTAERTTELQDINTATEMRTLMEAVDAYINQNRVALANDTTNSILTWQSVGAAPEDGDTAQLPVGRFSEFLPNGYRHRLLPSPDEPENATTLNGDKLYSRYEFSIHRNQIDETSPIQLVGYVIAVPENETTINDARAGRMASIIGANGGMAQVDRSIPESPRVTGISGTLGSWEATTEQVIPTAASQIPGTIVASSPNPVSAVEDEQFLWRTPDDEGGRRNSMRTDIHMTEIDRNGYTDHRFSIDGINRLIVGTVAPIAEDGKINGLPTGMEEEDALYLAGERGASIGGRLQAAAEQFLVNTGGLFYKADGAADTVITSTNNLEITSDISALRNDTNVTLQQDTGTSITLSSGNASTAATNNITNAAQGISLSTTGRQITPSTGNIEMHAKENILASAGTDGKVDITSGGAVPLTGAIDPDDPYGRTSVDNSINLASGANLNAAAGANVSINAGQAMGLYAKTDIVAETKTGNISATAEAGGITLSTNTATPTLVTGNIALDAAKDITATANAGNIDIKAKGNTPDIGQVNVTADDLIDIRSGGENVSTTRPGGANPAPGDILVTAKNNMILTAKSQATSDIVDSQITLGQSMIEISGRKTVIRGYVGEAWNDDTADPYDTIPLIAPVVDIIGYDSYDQSEHNMLATDIKTEDEDITKVEFNDNQNYVRIRQGVIALPSNRRRMKSMQPSNPHQGYIMADRLVSNTPLSPDAFNSVNLQYNGTATYDGEVGPGFKANESNPYTHYEVNPAYTSVMKDIKLTTRGGARLSDILPDFVNKGIYVVTNSYDEDLGGETQWVDKTFNPTGFTDKVCSKEDTGCTADEQVRATRPVSAFMGFIPTPLCPPRYGKVITLTPANFQMAEIGLRREDNAMGYPPSDGIDGVEHTWATGGIQIAPETLNTGQKTGQEGFQKIWQKNMWFRSQTNTYYDGQSDTKPSGNGIFRGWSAIGGFIYPAAWYGDEWIAKIRPAAVDTQNENNAKLIWNLFPVYNRTIEAYATVYCFFDRSNMVYNGSEGQFEPTEVDQYNQLKDAQTSESYKKDKYIDATGSAKDSSYGKNLNDPTLGYNSPW